MDTKRYSSSQLPIKSTTICLGCILCLWLTVAIINVLWLSLTGAGLWQSCSALFEGRMILAMLASTFFILAAGVLLDRQSAQRRHAPQADGSLPETNPALFVSERDQYNRIVFENSHIPIVVMDPCNYQFIDCNPAAVAIYGCTSREEIIGKKPTDVSTRTQYDNSLSSEKAVHYINLAKTQRSVVFEWRHQTFGGRVWDAEVHLLRFNIEEKEYLQFSLIDITERKRVAAELEQARKQAEENEERFRILHNASFGGIAIHENGTILDCNQGLSDVSGYSYTELVGMNGLLLIAEEYRDFVLDHIKARYEKAYEAFGLRKNGEKYPLRLEAREIPYKGLHVRVVEFRDISEQRKLEERLLQMEKMDAIGQLAGGIAHDFNNMLGGVFGAAELLQQRIPANDQMAEKFLSIILSSAQRAADLSGKLLAFARQQMIHSTPVDVHRAINDAVAILETTLDKRIKIRCLLAAEQSMVIGDNTQLQSVFLNLGINASHAMPEGGELTYASKVVDLSESYCKENAFELKPGNYIDIEVRDTGCGIAAQDIPRIFEPFYTTKEQGKGTGLGLAAAYGIMQQHNGSITVRSELGKGTCFHLLLPLSNDIAEGSAEKQGHLLGHGTILLVDDESVMRTVGQQLLIQWGYDVILAENGKDAVAIYHDRNQEIDLVILDMIMPEMNGRDCFFEIKKVRPDAHVILSSGFSRFEDIMDLKVHGLCGFIRKPFHSTELGSAVQKALAESIP